MSPTCRFAERSKCNGVQHSWAEHCDSRATWSAEVWAQRWALSPAGPSALRPIMGTNTCGCPIKPTNLRWRIDTSTFTPKCLSPHLSTGHGKNISTPGWPSLVLDRQKFPLSPDPLDLLDNSSFHRLGDLMRSEDAAHDHVEKLLVDLSLKMQESSKLSDPPSSHEASTSCRRRWPRRPSQFAWKRHHGHWSSWASWS